jgi:integrase
MSMPLRAYRPDLIPSEPLGDPASPSGFITHVNAVIDLYVEHLRARNRAGDYTDDALKGVIFELRRFGLEFGHQTIAACRQHDLTRFFGMNPQLKAPDTKKRVANTILGCFVWAFDEELIDRCPYRQPKALKGLKGHIRRPADSSEYVMLMRFGSRPLRRALFMLRRIGIRTKEMRDLTWPDVDLGIQPYIHLDKHKTRKKTGKARKIGLDTATANFLRALKRNQRGQSEHVFTNCDGTPWDRHTFARHLRRYAERLGIDEGVDERVSAYCVRHTYVCDGIEAGVTTRRIADQMGHIKTTMIDTVYGSHTRERAEHLGDVATEILRKRKRKVKVLKPQQDRFQQPGLFDGQE